MALFRWLVGMPMAALVTAALFFLMAELIRNKGVVVDENPTRKIPPITQQTRDSEIAEIKNPTDIIPDKMPPTDLKFPPVDGPTGGGVKPGPVDIERVPPGGGAMIGPVITIPPAYPESCRSRGVEGIVVVQFDVTPEGNVTNAQVIETPNACFVRPILKAVSGWKYPPSSNGSQMRYGLVETFNFQLVD